jgi:murein DD-endopeptidase MepM/ murein hydrolase activator NlpD
VQSYGQSYAIDLVADPVGGDRPGFAWWPIARRPGDFPGFGRTVCAPCDGIVVRVHDGERDHWSRTTVPGLLYMFPVELLRELFGPNRILGNHVVIDRGDGSYVALAHLRRASIQVGDGQQVRAGDPLAQCGNSGNSSEPHLHLQVMDHRRPLVAAGLPFTLRTGDGAAVPTPGNGAHLMVDEGAAA